MSTYHNAVSDKLVVFLYPSHTVFSIYSKDNILKFSVESSDYDVFPVTLKDAIFSTSHIVSVGARSTLVPLDISNWEAYFKANFGLKHNNLKYQNTDDCAIVYETSAAALLVESTLVNPEIYTDLDLIYAYASAKRYENAVYYWQYQKQLSIMVWKEGRLTLANRYAADTKDELFYYVMLAVEQIELSLDKLHIGCIADKDEHTLHHAMFQNYLPPIHLCNKDTLNGGDVMAQFFAECVL
jgi:hypothetical protein